MPQRTPRPRAHPSSSAPRPDPKANAKVARPRRTAKPRGENFPPGDRKGLVFSAKNFSRGAKISPRRGGLGAFRGDFPGEGRGGEARRAHGVRKSLRIAGGYAANPRGVQLRKKNARQPRCGSQRAFQGAIPCYLRCKIGKGLPLCPAPDIFPAEVLTVHQHPSAIYPSREPGHPNKAAH